MSEINVEAHINEEDWDLSEEQTIAIHVETTAMLAVMDPEIVRQWAIDNLGLVRAQ